MNDQSDIPKKILKLVDAIHVLDEQTVRRKVEQAAAAGLDIRYERIKRGGRAAANNYGIQRARA